MPEHIKPFNNKINSIVAVNNTTVPLVYFTHIKLDKGKIHEYHLENHESVIAVVSGSVDVTVDKKTFAIVGKRVSLWKGKPEGVCAGKGSDVKMTVLKDATEVCIAGGKIEEKSGWLLVSELFTAGAKGWSGFPSHKREENRLPLETYLKKYTNLYLIILTVSERNSHVRITPVNW